MVTLKENDEGLDSKKLEDLFGINFNKLTEEYKPKIDKILKLPENIVYDKLKFYSGDNLLDEVVQMVGDEDYKTGIITDFIDKSDNIFIFSQSNIKKLSEEELNFKIITIEKMIVLFENMNDKEKNNFIKENPIPDFNLFPEDVRKSINSKLSQDNSIFNSEGAENYNQGKINGDVYKLTKGRHSNDYFSILQLLKFMLSLERDFREENNKIEKQGKKIKIINANEGLIFYKNEQGDYRRLIKQTFAEGESVDIALKKEFYNFQVNFIKDNLEKNCIGKKSNCKYKKFINLEDPLDEILVEDFNTYLEETKSPLFQAYKDFIQSIQNISDEKGYLLDITDSRQGIKDKRGNILNTSNIFVKENNGIFEFRVIDPDVFNKDGRSKFSGKEQERTIIEKNKKEEIDGNIKYYKNKLLNILDAKTTGILTEFTNFARDGNDSEFLSKISVAPKQEKYMGKILKNKEYNISVDDKVRNDLIFNTNISRLGFRRFKEEEGNIKPISNNEIFDNEKKYTETIENLEKIGKKVKVIDFYPRNLEEETSGFGAVFLEVDGEKIFVPKGTKKEKGGKDTFLNYKKKDLKADLGLAFGKFPLEQVKSMIDFYERFEKKGEKIKIIGDSLGGTLGQIFNIMYPDNIIDANFVHSPGSLDLKISKSDLNLLSEKYKTRIEKYLKGHKKVNNNVTYIDGTNKFRPISGLGEKLGSSQKTKILEVQGWKLHTMPELIAYMKNLEKGDIVHVNELTIK